MTITSAIPLHLVLEGCKVVVKPLNKVASKSYRVKSLVGVEAVDILHRIKASVEGGMDSEINISIFLKECLDLYNKLTSADKETLYKTLAFLNWEGRNLLTMTMTSKLKSEWSNDIARLNLLQGSIEAGHTNTALLQEYLDLVHKLTKLKLIPASYSSALSRKVSSLFLLNVKADRTASKLQPTSSAN